MSDGEVRPFLGKGFKISFKNLLTYHQNAFLKYSNNIALLYHKNMKFSTSCSYLVWSQDIFCFFQKSVLFHLLPRLTDRRTEKSAPR